jgi:hypothetical protein
MEGRKAGTRHPAAWVQIPRAEADITTRRPSLTARRSALRAIKTVEATSTARNTADRIFELSV